MSEAKVLTADELGELNTYFGEHGELPHGVEEALLEMATGFLELRAYSTESAQPAERAGEWVTCVPRASVRWFAEQMELALRRNDHKGGWHKDAPSGLLERVDEESQELIDAIDYDDAKGAIAEAADVANMAMMVADHFREGGPSKDQGHTLPPPPQPKGKTTDV